MKELQNSLSSIIFHALDERFPKGDIKMMMQEHCSTSTMRQLDITFKRIQGGERRQPSHFPLIFKFQFVLNAIKYCKAWKSRVMPLCI
jgi:hypothetical protein